jgi:hypothetical protein
MRQRVSCRGVTPPPTVFGILLLGFAAVRMQGQTSLTVTAPTDGAIVPSGQTLMVTVSATSDVANVFLMGGGPIGLVSPASGPPYQFSIPIPADTTARTYTLVAAGAASGQMVRSNLVTIDIERPDPPVGISTSPVPLRFVGDQGQVSVIGTFADGSAADITYSSLTTYACDNPAVATVASDGTVTAVGAGSARISVNGKWWVPVSVPPAISMTPATGTSLYASQSFQFVATAANANSNSSVIWSLSAGSPGTVDNTGLYTAPASVSAQQNVTVTATSADDSSKTVSSTLTLRPGSVAISVSPSAASLYAGEPQQFTASVSNDGNAGVTWSISPYTSGGIVQGGTYTAPATISSQQVVTVTGTSIADPTKVATAVVTLYPLPTLTTISPTSAARGATVTVTFTGTSFLRWTGASPDNPDIAVTNDTLINPTQARATFTISSTAALGTTDVYLRTPAGSVGPVSFTVTSAQPTLTSISPTSGVQATAVAVTLTGTNFVSGATVSTTNSGIAVSNVTVVSATQITATFNIAANATLGMTNVTVTTSGGTSSPVVFTVLAPPTLTSISPTSGVQGTAVPVTLAGTNFVSGATVSTTNSGITVSNVTVTSATQITATFQANARVATDPTQGVTAFNKHSLQDTPAAFALVYGSDPADISNLAHCDQSPPSLGADAKSGGFSNDGSMINIVLPQVIACGYIRRTSTAPTLPYSQSLTLQRTIAHETGHKFRLYHLYRFVVYNPNFHSGQFFPSIGSLNLYDYFRDDSPGVTDAIYLRYEEINYQKLDPRTNTLIPTTTHETLEGGLTCQAELQQYGTSVTTAPSYSNTVYRLNFCTPSPIPSKTGPRPSGNCEQRFATQIFSDYNALPYLRVHTTTISRTQRGRPAYGTDMMGLFSPYVTLYEFDERCELPHLRVIPLPN